MVVNYISGLVFVGLMILGLLGLIPVALYSPPLAVFLGIIWFLLDSIISSGVRRPSVRKWASVGGAWSPRTPDSRSIR